eukprot:scaffold24935_cov93-Cylindrotheca_fusiformis.AAC.3
MRITLDHSGGRRAKSHRNPRVPQMTHEASVTWRRTPAMYCPFLSVTAERKVGTSIAPEESGVDEQEDPEKETAGTGREGK